MKKIVILGGTGFVGRSLCEQLTAHFDAAGVRLLVPSRRPQRAKHLLTLPTVQLVQADIHNDSELAALLLGADAVINLVAILHGSAADFERAHVTLPKKLGQACRATGVRRLLHVSALGAAANAPSEYLRSKSGGELALRAAGLDLSVLRPSVIFGADDRFLNVFAQLQSIFPFMPLACAEARFQPVWVEDVAQALIACLTRPLSSVRTFECAGPRVYTLRELVQLAGAWSGHPRPVIGLPTAIGRLQARLMGLAPGEPLMSIDNIDSMSVPNVATGSLPGLADLGITATSLEAIGPTYLSPVRGPSRLNSWRAHAHRG